jgi:hypothetical protein
MFAGPLDPSLISLLAFAVFAATRLQAEDKERFLAITSFMTLLIQARP